MAESGLVEAVTAIEVQTHLTADAAAGATVLTVESTEQFDPAGGQLSVSDGTPVDYLTCDDTTITLAASLVASADDGEPVTLVLGGQRATQWVAEVSFGEEETVPVPVGYEQRAMWPPGPYDPAVPVTVSDDLSRIIDTPGRTPSIDASYVDWPAAKAAKGSNQAIPHNVWTKLTGWFTLKLNQVEFDAGTGEFVFLRDGEYDVRLGVTFDTNTSGQRAIRMHYTFLGVDVGPSRDVRVPSEGYVGIETNQSVSVTAGQRVYFEVFQNGSGVGNTLDVLGSNVFTDPPETECSIRYVGPN